jgi:putative polyhydroxyalkanoate system protein
MKTLEVRLPHSLGAEAVHQKLDAALVKARAQYEQQVGPIEASWESDDRLKVGLAVMGMRFDGQIDVLPDELVVKLDLPMMASMFAGKIREGIEQQLAALIKA